MDIVDLPATFAVIVRYLQRDVVLSVVVCSAVVLIVMGAVKIRNQKQRKRISSLRVSSEDEGEYHPHDTMEDLVPLVYSRVPVSEMKRGAEEFYEKMKKRRSCRVFSPDPVPEEIIDDIIKTAGTAPSGANLQPWTYVVVKDPEIKSRLQEIVEEEEYVNYTRRMGEKWVQDLEKFKTNWKKPYFTTAPYIILLFRHEYGIRDDNTKQVVYYKELSSAISAGFFLAAVQNAGLVTVTTTPLHCGKRIGQLLDQPENERLILLFPVGYPAIDAKVPKISKKPLHKIMVKY